MHDGRRITVTPRPLTAGGPGIDVGRRNGGGGAAGRQVRPGHAGQRECARHAGGLRGGLPQARPQAGRRHSFPTATPRRSCFVADDVDQAWSELGEHLLHDVRTYAAWNPGNETSAGFSHVTTVDELRDTPASHVIISVPEAISRVRAGEVLNLSPLCGGLPPEIAWPYLKRVGEVVLPEALSRDEKASTYDRSRHRPRFTTTRSISTSTTIRTRSGSGCATKPRCTTTRSTTSTR